MTSIVIPVSTPGANESANDLNRAADAVVKLAKGLDAERAAATAVVQARREAIATSKAMAQADKDRLATVKATTEAIKQESAAARQAAEMEMRDIIAQRSKLGGGGNGGGGNGGGGGGGNHGGGFSSGIRRHAGLVSGALSGGMPDIGSVASGLIAGGGVAVVAAGAAAVGLGIAAVVGSMRQASEAATRLAENVRHAAEFVRDANHEAGNAAGSAMDSNGSALIAAQTRNPNALAAARKSVMSLPGVSASDALSMEKSGLSDGQKKAAAMAAAITGGSVAGYGEKLRSGHVNMSDPNQMASYLLSMEGRFMSPAATGAAFDLGQQGAGDINDRTRSQATSALDALSPSSQSAGAKEGRYDRMKSSLTRNAPLSARAKANNARQSDRIKLEEEAEHESFFDQWTGLAGSLFGGAGNKNQQLLKYDRSFLFGENIGSKVVIANGNKN